NLATQTAKATEEISQQIASIQSATGEAVGAIQGIGKTIVEINQVASSIAAAVEEQNASTREIARNVQETSAGTQEGASKIAGVNPAAAGRSRCGARHRSWRSSPTPCVPRSPASCRASAGRRARQGRGSPPPAAPTCGGRPTCRGDHGSATHAANADRSASGRGRKFG